MQYLTFCYPVGGLSSKISRVDLTRISSRKTVLIAKKLLITEYTHACTSFNQPGTRKQHVICFYYYDVSPID